MSYSLSLVLRCIAELIVYYSWKRVILIYQENEYESIGATIKMLLSDTLQSAGADIDHIVAFPPPDLLKEPRALVQQELLTVERRLCKVFVLVRLSASLGHHLFMEAWKLGMMSKGHVWMTDDQTSSFLLSDIRAVAPYVQGVLGISPYFNTSTSLYRQLELRMEQQFQAYSLVPYAYDAVNAVVLAASTTEKRNMTLFGEILSSNFEGLSGHVKFKVVKGGVLRETSYIAFSILNFIEMQYKEIGLWSEAHGFYRNSRFGHGVKSVKGLGRMSWTSGSHRTPSGWGKLRVGVPARTSFDQFVKVERSHDGKFNWVTGYCIDVFNRTLQRLSYDLKYEFVPFGGKYDELVDQVHLKKFDAAVGDITILAKRLEKVDFTEPYVSSDLSMVVHVEPDSKGWVFMKPFTGGVWALIVFTFIYTAMVVWCLEHKDNPEFDGTWKKQVGATLWLMVCTAFFDHRKIKSYYTRAVVMPLFFTALVVTQVYTANLSSILTTQKLQPLISDREIGCDGESFIVKYLQDVLGYPPQRIHMLGSAENYPKAFQSGTITAAYMESPYLRVFLSRHKDYVVHGESHRLGGLGFAFPRGSPLVYDFSKAILQLSEEGVLKDLENKWFSFSLSNCPSTHTDVNKDSIGLDNMWTLFVLTGGIISLVFLVFISQLHQGRRHFRVKIGKLLKDVREPRSRFRRTHSKKVELQLSTSVSSNDETEEQAEKVDDATTKHWESLNVDMQLHHEDGEIEEVKGQRCPFK